jgi:hypothetical protein
MTTPLAYSASAPARDPAVRADAPVPFPSSPTPKEFAVALTHVFERAASSLGGNFLRVFRAVEATAVQLRGQATAAR